MIRHAARVAPLALLGGSFDPIHAGHLQLARDALAGLPIGALRLLPAGQPWQKPGVSAAVHRVAMVERAVASWPAELRERVSIDLREVARDGPTYTVDTLAGLRAELGADLPLVLIVGSDQLAGLDSWHRWDLLPRLAHLAVARRAGAVLQMPPAVVDRYPAGLQDPATLTRSPAGALVELPMTAVDASASALRAMLRAGPPYDPRVAAWLDAAVLAYIDQHHLYD